MQLLGACWAPAAVASTPAALTLRVSSSLMQMVPSPHSGGTAHHVILAGGGMKPEAGSTVYNPCPMSPCHMPTVRIDRCVHRTEEGLSITNMKSVES